MGPMASQITSLTIVYPTVYSGADQRKHQSSVSLAFVRGIHRGPVNSPHKWPVTRKTLPFDDVIMSYVHGRGVSQGHHTLCCQYHIWWWWLGDVRILALCLDPHQKGWIYLIQNRISHYQDKLTKEETVMSATVIDIFRWWQDGWHFSDDISKPFCNEKWISIMFL